MAVSTDKLIPGVLPPRDEQEDIANTALLLCSGKAGFITSENTCADGRMTKLVIFNDDHGWMYRP